MATTKAEAGKALGAATNDIKTFAEKDEAARQAHREELQKAIRRHGGQDRRGSSRQISAVTSPAAYCDASRG